VIQTRSAIADGMLFTDMYQLTMAQLYFRQGIAEREAQFDYFFRSYPDYGEHQAGFCVNAGLEWLLDWVAATRITAAEVEVLRGLRGGAGAPLFAADFLAWLGCAGSFAELSLRAVPEGRVVHPNVPLVVVRGPLALAQILETALVNRLAYPTLVATKAARIREVAQGGAILEFGTRRAQERAANAGARAALVGGADFTSNVALSAMVGLPPKGTHAHSMVQAFLALGGGELEAFRAYAALYPDDCLLLVDTVDTLGSGVPNAIRVFEELRRAGHRPLGIRLDSGDLAYLAIQSAKQLDAAGFADVAIVLSNQLDELVIWQVVTQIRAEAGRAGVDPEALIRRLVYGVGTRLVTSGGAGALDGVYKLVAVRRDGAWAPTLKLSETPSKSLNPGDKGVWRIYDRRGRATADLLTRDGERPVPGEPLVLHHPSRQEVLRTLPAGEVSEVEPLLVDVFRDGRLACELPPLAALRERRDRDVERLDAGVRRLMNPHIYHVSLSDALWRTKQELIAAVRR